VNGFSKSAHYSRYISFSRAEWAVLRDATPLTLSEDDLATVNSITERVSLQEVTEIYLPLTRLISMYADAAQKLHQASNAFLGSAVDKVPFIIGIAGSVAVGKSTTARILRTLLSRGEGHLKVDLVTTDGFLYPNEVLLQKELMHRKGFPESYDVRKLIRFLADVKSGRPEVTAPVYSHVTYDIVPDEAVVVRNPDIVIVEGLNVLQTNRQSSAEPSRIPRLFVSDFFDFTIYVDADESQIKQWYIERFHALRRTAFQNAHSFFHRYAGQTEAEATQTASSIWDEINAVNLRENVLPTRPRAQLILQKAANHVVQRVSLRKL